MVGSLVGQTLGQYRVVAELGRGQHSVVYRAWQESLQRFVALKVLQTYDERTFRKFQDEARLTARLIQDGVPNIRQVYEVSQTADGYLFVALEYVDDSLRNVIQRAKQHGRRINPTAASRLLQPVADALDVLHSLGWVHLDIKPQNILIFKGGRAVLADFGIAQRRGQNTHACTPAYASPEQAAGDRPVGPWSDIYSLGVVLYEMIAGHPPVRGDHDIVLLNQHLEVKPPSPRKVNPSFTPGQERAIFRALEKQPQRRFRTAGEMIQAMLRSSASKSGVAEVPSAVLSITSTWTRRMPRALVAGGLIVLILAILALMGWVLLPYFRWSDATAPAETPTRAATATQTSVTTTATASVTVTVVQSPAVKVTATPTLGSTATLVPTSTRLPRPTSTRPKPAPTVTRLEETPEPTESPSP